MEFTTTEIKNIMDEATTAAHEAANEYFQTSYLQGTDNFPCGFAWIDICGIKASTKLGRAMKAAGIKKAYNGSFQIWNPSNFGCQNIDTKEAGAQAAAKVFRSYGFDAYAGSRLD